MSKKIILFGGFLSSFILFLVPNICCVNSIIQKDEISNIRNIEIDDLKKIKSILNLDCGCQNSKAIDSKNSKLLYPFFYICETLFIILIIVAFFIKCVYNLPDFFPDFLYYLLFFPLIGVEGVIVIFAIIFNCDWINLP